MAAAAKEPKPDKRRVILDAAVTAFAKRGFHQCRVSDIADEANVAYGLVYHYFRSKDEVLDTLFLERWDILLQFIAETDRQAIAPRDKLQAIAAAIIDFYRYDPALMKVIIVEVMRSANSFGMRHAEKIVEAYALIGDIVSKAQAEGTFKREVSPRFAALAFYGAIEQVLTGWIFGMLPEGEAEYEQAKVSIVETICGGLDEVSGRAARYV
jgi:AcrR family transcriptional regulator